MPSKLSEDMLTLLDIIRELRAKPDAEAFNEPVDPSVPYYYAVIKKPMDLGKIESRLMKGTYKSPQQVIDDVQLVWDNCKTYNEDDAEVSIQATRLSKWFQQKVRPLGYSAHDPTIVELQINLGATPTPTTATVDHTTRTSVGTPERKSGGGAKPSTRSSGKHKAAADVENNTKPSTVWTYDDRRALGERIAIAVDPTLRRIFRVIKDKAPQCIRKESLEYVIDFSKLDSDVLVSLNAIVGE
eukprot:PhF_6_TR11017/c0_g1_i1/m.17841